MGLVRLFCSVWTSWRRGARKYKRRCFVFLSIRDWSESAVTGSRQVRQQSVDCLVASVASIDKGPSIAQTAPRVSDHLTMAPPRKTAQAKGRSSPAASSSNSNKKIEIRSKIFVPGFSVDAKPNEPMKDLDEEMRRVVLKKINSVFGSELTQEDLPVTGNERRVVYVGHSLPDDYQARSVGELFPDKDHVTVHFSPHPARIIETRSERQQREAQVLLDSELATTRTELDFTKKEMTAQGLRLDIALGENVEKKTKQKATQPLPSEKAQLLAEIETMMKRRDEEWESQLSNVRVELKQGKVELEQVKVELEREKEDRRRGDEELFKIIRPLRLRILLDKTRDRFLQDLQFNTWPELSRNRPVEEYVIDNLRSHHRPTEDAIRWCLQTNNTIREAGNKSAHEAEEQDVREAVLSVPAESEERKHLHSLFTYAYQGSHL
ncbi:hypothetical protein FPV67DRAFT_877264 [Lyophyllum atratum]|nr:hypothetical protein FPV67DRAFT_877264 [Lyophyllum atratum]